MTTETRTFEFPAPPSWVGSGGMPRVTLSNGVRVGNFSSGHEFAFEDGSILAACSAVRVEGLALGCDDEESASPLHPACVDVAKKFRLYGADGIVEDEHFRDALVEADGDDTIDVVIVPFPLLQALREGSFRNRKFRTIFTVRRAQGGAGPVVSITRFCK